jgi:hypothetical protein
VQGFLEAMNPQLGQGVKKKRKDVSSTKPKDMAGSPLI